MAKNRFNHSWLHDHINDPYVKLAQREGYRARAAYKLKEIDEQDKLIRPGQVIVDLGSTPGSWSQYARNKLAQGLASATQSAKAASTARSSRSTCCRWSRSPTCIFIQGDFREDSVLEQLEGNGRRTTKLIL